VAVQRYARRVLVSSKHEKPLPKANSSRAPPGTFFKINEDDLPGEYSSILKGKILPAALNI